MKTSLENVTSPTWFACVGTVAVILSTVILVALPGYGSALFAFIGAIAYDAVYLPTSTGFADSHKALVSLVAAVLNGLFFAIPSLLIITILRKKRVITRNLVLLSWLLIYSEMLFLFPRATDGP